MQPHIRLVMIVRNESATIARCLRAARPIIDSFSIVDTGSTDNTREIIAHELAGIPGALYERPWRNFGANRQESFDLARADLSDPANTWCLLLDADHELVPRGFDKRSLTEPGYYIQQYDGSLEYDNVRLIRADVNWKCIGVTHEVWVAPNFVPKRIAGMRIADHCDGGMHSEKYTRDEFLLRHGLIDEPGNARYMFYLAQTLECLGRYPEAIEWYAKRTTADSNAEEIWMARLRIGRLQMVNPDTAAAGIATLIAAYNDRPHRAEPLHTLARHYRLSGKNAAAMLIADTARRIPKPVNDKLFVESGVYETGIDEEIAISAWYCGRKDEGLAATERLLKRYSGHAEAQQNVSHYAERIPTLDRGTFDVPEAARTFNGTVYSCSNPSVCGKHFNVRLVNYDQHRGRHYISRDIDGRIRTHNALNELPLYDALPGTWPRDTAIQGLEDIRLFTFRDRTWFSATCCQVPGADGRPQIVLGRLSADLGTVDHIVPVQYPEAQSVEKNWVMWPQADGGLRCVYSFNPLTILDIDPETGAAKLRTARLLQTYAGRFRGSAGPVLGDLFLTHDVARHEHENVYTHRFVKVAPGCDGLDFSAPFVFDHWGIEYACGMTIIGNRLRISYGFEDREARWVDVSLADALEATCTNSL